MSIPYDAAYIPPVPVVSIRLAAPGEPPQVKPLSAVVDTGSDGTLIPTHCLEQVEAIDVGDAILHGVLGEAREIHLNVLNKLILLLDGQSSETDLFEKRPPWR